MSGPAFGRASIHRPTPKASRAWQGYGRTPTMWRPGRSAKPCPRRPVRCIPKVGAGDASVHAVGSRSPPGDHGQRTHRAADLPHRLGNRDDRQLPASLHRFVGNNAYDTAAPQQTWHASKSSAAVTDDQPFAADEAGRPSTRSHLERRLGRVRGRRRCPTTGSPCRTPSRLAPSPAAPPAQRRPDDPIIGAQDRLDGIICTGRRRTIFTHLPRVERCRSPWLATLACRPIFGLVARQPP